MNAAQQLLHAIAYLPPGVPIGGPLAAVCRNYAERQGYALTGVAHTYEDILAMFAAGSIQIAIFARREHWNPLWLPRIEFATNDATSPQLLIPTTQAEAKRRHRNRPQIIN